MPEPKRIGVFGWGLVAPGAKNVEAFDRRLREGGSWLSEFTGFGPSNFLAGMPTFEFEDYKAWIDARFPPSRFPALRKKFGGPTQYAIGAFIQALAQNEGMEKELEALGGQAQCIIGAGLSDVPTYDDIGRELFRAQRRWNRFWADPSHNQALRNHLSGEATDPSAPADPAGVDVADRDDAEEAYWAYWAARSPELREYLAALREIEGLTMDGPVEQTKGRLIKKKRAALLELRKQWGAPEAPWDCVRADALWNIGNTPASELSMLGKIRGMCIAPFAACSSFGVALKLGIDSIRRGEAKLAVIGATEPAPHPVTIGTFYNARVLSHDGEVSKPLTGLRGTHVSGGACVWIIGDLDHYTAKGWKPLGMEPISVGITADADHIITPSVEGPSEAIRTALQNAQVSPDQIAEWDLHATGTPGDVLEVHTARMQLPPGVRMTARKGTFGHGMGAGGGWELTAQYLGFANGELPPTELHGDELNAQIGQEHDNFVYDKACKTGGDVAGKLSMGIGGINACVVSRKLGSNG